MAQNIADDMENNQILNRKDDWKLSKTIVLDKCNGSHFQNKHMLLDALYVNSMYIINMM